MSINNTLTKHWEHFNIWRLMFVETKPQTMNTQETAKASVLIFSNIEEINNNNPTRRNFEFLCTAQLYADMLNSSYSFPLIRVLDHNGQIYCEHEN